MNLKLNLSEKEFYYKYYTSLNGILNLTKKEILILSILSDKKLKGTSDKELFSSKIRKEIAEALDISKFNLNNYIKSLADRKILLRSKRELKINPTIYVDITDYRYVDFNIRYNIIYGE